MKKTFGGSGYDIACAQSVGPITYEIKSSGPRWEACEFNPHFRNNIYYISKDINKLYAHYTSLQEENKFLAQQLEDMKFKNQIIDSLLFNPLEIKK